MTRYAASRHPFVRFDGTNVRDVLDVAEAATGAGTRWVSAPDVGNLKIRETEVRPEWVVEVPAGSYVVAVALGRPPDVLDEATFRETR